MKRHRVGKGRRKNAGMISFLVNEPKRRALFCRACGDAVTAKNAEHHAAELLADARLAYDMEREDLARELRDEADDILGARQ
jgi:hypothetical protein